MPVSFISNGYEQPQAGEAWAVAHPSIGASRYGVTSPGHWQVSPAAGELTLSIAAGSGHGLGITDLTTSADLITLDPITSGTRWDLIALRRNWQPPGGVSRFIKVTGTSARVIPAGRNTTIGNIDDQPLALVKVEAGKSEPVEIIDLRTWAGEGGGIVAVHELVKDYLNKAGTHLTIGGATWTRTHDLKWELTSPAMKAETRVFPATNANGDSIYTFPAPFHTALTSVVVTDAQSTGGFGAVSVKIINELTDRTRVCVRFLNPDGSPLAGMALKVSFIAVGY